ncbi:hypothetical protein [Microvirgula aerodenitrificans]|uniref:hypothetical protein n=1 Tax=Microvirgula aerodenitrificans TaxID=57480 RepID=UPI00248ED585|nr:hypothetical protein [Microvirgula aerodenitrificans]
MTDPILTRLMTPATPQALSRLRANPARTVLIDDAAFLDQAPDRVSECRARLLGTVTHLITLGLHQPDHHALAATSRLPELYTLTHTLRARLPGLAPATARLAAASLVAGGLPADECERLDVIDVLSAAGIDLPEGEAFHLLSLDALPAAALAFDAADALSLLEAGRTRLTR